MATTLQTAAAEMIRHPSLVKITVDGKRLSREEVANLIEAPHGWVWMDDDGWEYSPIHQHPQLRGEAEYGKEFRPATAAEAQSPDFFRPAEVHMTFGGNR